MAVLCSLFLYPGGQWSFRLVLLSIIHGQYFINGVRPVIYTGHSFGKMVFTNQLMVDINSIAIKYAGNKWY